MGLNLSITTVDEMDQGEVVDVQGEIIFHFHTYIIAMYDFKIQNSTLIHIYNNVVRIDRIIIVH